MKTKTVILIILVIFMACKSRNKLNSNVEKLCVEILQEEEEKQNLQNRDLNFGSNTQAITMTENRSVDKQNPPIVLDIINARYKIKTIKYSDLGNKVSYIFLQHPEDTAFFKHGVNILFTPNNIIASTWHGIGRFDLKGQFIEMICRDGKKFEIDDRGMRWSTRELMNQYVGSKGKVSAIGDRIFYRYVDNPKQEACLMEYDASPQNRSLILPGRTEDGQLKGKGDIITILPSEQKSDDITLLDENHWLIAQRKFSSSKSGIFMTVHSLNGDTVCSIKDNDPIINFSNSTYRGVESGDNYRLNGTLHVRQNFNDTIYQFIGTNRLVPRYVIDLGAKGVKSSAEAVSPSINLQDKYVYSGTVETNDFLFFTYTQDYSCPNTSKSGSLKYNRFVLNKRTGEQFHAYVDEVPYMAEGKMVWPGAPQKGIVNDLDFGVAQWPCAQTDDGRLYFQISGKVLKKHTKENLGSSLTLNKKRLLNYAANCKEDDVILMIIE